MGEGGGVGVVDADLEEEGEIETDPDRRDADARRDAVDAGGDEFGGWIVESEEGEVEDED